MALAESLILGTVLLTAAGLIGYRIRRREKPQLLLGGGTREATAARKAIDAKTVMMIVVSVLVLCSSLFIILSKGYDAASQKWAFGVVGTIVGFWFRPEK